MAMSFRASRFRHRENVGEDVNPSAYIVNLADCMLVLAVGFAVALISHWNIPLAKIEQVEESQMQKIDPESLPEDVTTSGSYYEEAGVAYRDPSTGQLYIIEGATGEDGSNGDTVSNENSSSSSVNASGQPTTSSSQSASKQSSSATNTDIVNARANGGD